MNRLTPRQLPLAFDHRPSFEGEDFLVAPCNAAAVDWLDRWPGWPSTALVVHGAPGCGKTHLGRVFQGRSGARAVTADDLHGDDPAGLAESASAFVVDDADAVIGDGGARAFLHFFNSVDEAGGHLLAMARQPAARWTVALADLASRLKAQATVAISAPDDALISALLVKLFDDRQLRVDDGVVLYMLHRMERSFDAARALVARVDAAALAETRNITVPLVRGVMGGADTQSGGDKPWT